MTPPRHPRPDPPLARTRRPHRLRRGSRLHGDERLLRRPRRRGVDRDHPPGARPRRHVPRHVRHVRPVHQRAARRSRDRRAAATRSPWRRSSASSVRPTTRPEARRCAVTPHTCARPATRRSQRLGIDTIDLYYAHRTDPNDADRGDGRRDGRAGRRRQGAVPRALRGRGGHAAARRRGAPDRRRCRASGRCGAATSRPRWSRSPASSASASSRTARSGAGSSPARSPRSTTSRPTTSAASTRGSWATTSPRTSTWSTQVRKLAADKGCTPGPARARLGARPGRRRRADPGHEARALPRGERRRPRRRAHGRRTSRPSTRRSRIDAFAGDRYPDMSRDRAAHPSSSPERTSSRDHRGAPAAPAIRTHEGTHEHRTARRQLLLARHSRVHRAHARRASRRGAEEAGISHLSVMDHWFQMEALAPATEPMMEGYTTLGFLAAHTSTIRSASW